MGQPIRAEVMPRKVLFEDATSGFRIVSCVCFTSGVPVNPQYKSLTIKGSNLENIKVGRKEDLLLEPIEDKTHPYGYRLVGYNGVNYGSDRVELTEMAELQSLRRIMTERQAVSCHESYPHFVEMILNGLESDISYTNIKYVGMRLLAKYIKQIKAMHLEVRFIGATSTWGIESSSDVQKIAARYEEPAQFEAAMDANPYEVLMDVLDWSFGRSDKLVARMLPQFMNSMERAEAASIAILKVTEQSGNTRMSASVLFEQFTALAPQAMPNLYKAVTESPRIHYDATRKLVSLADTYNAEQFIADTLKEKIAHPHLLPMKWQEHINADGLSLTEEQAKILEMACSKDAMMLTGWAGCVDCDTEFFTGTGWKRIADYQNGDMVLQYNEDGTAELVNPIAYIKKPCDTLWHFETLRGLNQTVCDEHRIIYETRDGVLKECNIEQLKQMHLPSTKNFQGRFLTTFNFGGSGIDLNEWQIRLMCAVLADGHFNVANKNSTRCTFHIKKQRKKDRLIYLFNKNGLEYKEHESTEEGYTDYHVYVPRREKQFTEYWYGCSNDQLKIIIDEVIYWDGCIRYTKNNTKYQSYSSAIKSDADFIQYAAASAGIRASISISNRIGETHIVNDKKYIRKTNLYVVNFSNRTKVGLCSDNRSKCTKTPITQVPTTDGYKYCFTVPSHMLVLRRKDCIFITGNCGKTTSMQALVNMLDSNGYTYTLLAPTGISSKKLREATQKEASTIHMFLTMSENLGDYLIIDEASQISVHLLSMLFNKVTDDTKIIFIADPSQLASISCGNVVRDLLDSGVIPVANLTKVFRYNSSGIITLSTDVRNGCNEHLTDTYTDYKFIPISTQAIKQIGEEYAALVSGNYNPSDVLILSPFNKGPVGSMAINAAIQAKFNPNSMSGIAYKRDGVEIGFKVGDRVINKKNEYSMPLYDSDETAFVANGDIGTVLAIDPDEYSMTVQFDCGVCHVDRAHIQHLLLGYCISVHACQGSQAKAVMVVIDPSHGHMLSRNLLYTAMTRAQERLVVIGDVVAIEHGLDIQEEMQRNTWLKEMIMK